MRGPAGDRGARRPARPGPATTLQPLVPHPVAAGLPPADRHPPGPAHARAHRRTRPTCTSSDRSAPPRRRASCSARSHRRPIPTALLDALAARVRDLAGSTGARAEHGACEDAPARAADDPGVARTRGCSSSTRRKAASRCAAGRARLRERHTTATHDERHAGRRRRAAARRRAGSRATRAGCAWSTPRACGRRSCRAHRWPSPNARNSQPCEVAAARARAACATARCTAPRIARCPP